MGQALYHDGACTCATLANLTQKVGLPGREKFEPQFAFSRPKTSIRPRSCLTWQERRRLLHSRRHVRRCAATSEFMAYSMGCRCTRRRRRSSGGARRRGPHPRFIDATASCEPSPGSAVGHAPAGQPRCWQRFRAGSKKSPSSRCPQAAAACGALHAPSAYMPASQARTGIRHEEGPGAARERAAPLRHSAARCRVENRTHAAQARLRTHVCAIEHLLTTNLRLCQNARHRTSLAAAADMKLRYAVLLYTRAKTQRSR